MLTLSTYQNLLLEMFGIGSVQELKKIFHLIRYLLWNITSDIFTENSVIGY